MSNKQIRGAVRIAVGVLAAAGVVLGIDLAVTDGKTARGATVAGVEMGNLSPTAARAALDDLQKWTTAPVTLRTETGTMSVAPGGLGLRFDEDTTLSDLRDQPRNPVSRLLAMVGVSHDVSPVVTVDRAALDAELDKHQATLEKAAVEGGVHFTGTTPVADDPKAGRRIDRDAAEGAIAHGWLFGTPIDLPMEPFSPSVSAEVVTATVDGPATRATSGPIMLTGPDLKAVQMTPDEVGAVLTFVPDGKGGLVAHVDEKRTRDVLASRVAPAERRAVDARFSLRTGSPTVVPSVEGRRIDWGKTIERIAVTATADFGTRSVEVVTDTVRPRLDTRAANRLGVTEVVSEFTTSGFAAASGENIRIVAEKVDGAVLKPGQTFSLNGFTGPRGTAQGYVTSTIIDHGHAAKAVGGGISQFATTLYNASYFAGLEDIEHTEHSYYISRYPEAREATVFEGAIDLKFRNNSAHGILIETNWTPSSVTVRLWGTKTVDVESVTGDRTAYTAPPSLELKAGDNCIESNGSRGFTASNTRIITDAKTGAEIYRHTRTVKYDPEPKVRCVA